MDGKFIDADTSSFSFETQDSELVRKINKLVPLNYFGSKPSSKSVEVSNKKAKPFLGLPKEQVHDLFNLLKPYVDVKQHEDLEACLSNNDKELKDPIEFDLQSAQLIDVFYKYSKKGLKILTAKDSQICMWLSVNCKTNKQNGNEKSHIVYSTAQSQFKDKKDGRSRVHNPLIELDTSKISLKENRN